MAVKRRIVLVVLLAAVAGCGPTVRVEPVADVKAQGDVSAVAFSPSGSALATAERGWDGGPTPGANGVVLRDAATRRVLRRIPVSGRVNALAFAPGGAMLAVADGGGGGTGHAHVFNPANGERLASLDGSTDWVHGLAFSPDGALLAACGSTFTSGGNEGGRVTVWEVSGWRERPGHGRPERTYRSVAFDPGGRTYVTGGGVCDAGRPDLGEVTLWDAATGRPLWSHRGHARVVDCVAFAPGGDLIASGGMDGVLKLWDAADGGESFAADLSGAHDGRVLSVAFAPAGASLAVGLGGHDRGALRVLEVGGKAVRVLQVFQGASPITCVAFSPDGRLLAAGDGAGTVRIWEAAECLRVGTRE